jgi:Lar family restriction alleviation protein
MSEELKPCPFCGEDNAVVVETDYEGNADIVTAYAVSCRTKRCAASIWALSMGLFDKKERAIKAWNTRTPPEYKYQKFADYCEESEWSYDKELSFNAARDLKEK